MMTTQNSAMGDEELRKEILTEFKQVLKLAPTDYTESCTNVVMSIIKSRDQQIALAAQLQVLNKIAQAYHREEYQDKAREALSMALWAEIRSLEQAQNKEK